MLKIGQSTWLGSSLANCWNWHSRILLSRFSIVTFHPFFFFGIDLEGFTFEKQQAMIYHNLLLSFCGVRYHYPDCSLIDFNVSITKIWHIIAFHPFLHFANFALWYYRSQQQCAPSLMWNQGVEGRKVHKLEKRQNDV